jgi:hypothetical protein
MKIRVGYELVFDFPQSTPVIMVLGTRFTRASDVDQTGWANCGYVERRTEIASGVPGVMLTCTSMSRWSDGDPKKVPWSGIAWCGSRTTAT